jgi:opacity protein-like surface antigen
MRLRAAALLIVALAAPAAAADTNIADQAKGAYATFAGGLSQQDFLTARYGKPLFSGIAGNWVRLSGPNNTSGIESYGADSDKLCKSDAALTLSSPNPLTLTLGTNLKAGNFSQQYTLVAGSTFSEYTDPSAYFGDQVDQQRAVLLSLANGLVQIYRPSADIVVLTRDRAYPIVLARCAAAPAPAAN